MRTTSPPDRREFGSEIAKKIEIQAAEVGAIVGSIVGGAAAAFVIGRFQGGGSLPFLLYDPSLIDPLSDEFLAAGAKGVLVAVPADSAVSPDEEGEEFAGVRFLTRTRRSGNVKHARAPRTKERVS